MSKSILVVDTPKNGCNDCKLESWHNGKGRCMTQQLRGLDVTKYCNVGSERHPNCPLQELSLDSSEVMNEIGVLKDYYELNNITSDSWNILENFILQAQATEIKLAELREKHKKVKVKYTPAEYGRVYKSCSRCEAKAIDKYCQECGAELDYHKGVNE